MKITKRRKKRRSPSVLGLFFKTPHINQCLACIVAAALKNGAVVTRAAATTTVAPAVATTASVAAAASVHKPKRRSVAIDSVVKVKSVTDQLHECVSSPESVAFAAARTVVNLASGYEAILGIEGAENCSGYLLLIVLVEWVHPIISPSDFMEHLYEMILKSLFSSCGEFDKTCSLNRGLKPLRTFT